MDKQLEKLDKEILEWKLKLKKCSSIPAYRDTKKHLDKLYQQRALYKRLLKDSINIQN